MTSEQPLNPIQQKLRAALGEQAVQASPTPQHPAVRVPENAEQPDDSLAAGFDDDDSGATDEVEETEELEASDETVETEGEESEPGDSQEIDMTREVTLPDGSTKTVGDLAQGYMRNKHHTQSLQGMAEVRKTFENTTGMLQAIEQAGWAILAPDIQPYENLNLEQLAASDPERYKRIKPHYDAVMQRAQQFQHQLGQIYQAVNAQAQHGYEKVWEQIHTDLQYSVPGYKAGETLPKLSKYAQESVGFKEEELAQYADSRLWKLIAKAKAFDDLKHGKRQTKSGRPSVKGNASRVQQVSEAAKQRRLQQRSKQGDRKATSELLRGKIRSKINLARQ